MLTISTALRQGVELLEADAISAPRLTAEVLLAHVLRRDRTYLYAYPERELTEVEWIHYGRYLHERLAGKPTQYITRRQEFYGRTFRVEPAAFIPRPETELVVETALRLAGGAERILDLGTGAGCLAVTLKKERPQARVFASDLSMAALELARENARRLEAAVDFFRADALEGCAEGRLDLVVSNPPYVPEAEAGGLPREVREHEPALALFGGADGTAFYPRLMRGALGVLRTGGWLIAEIGFSSRRKVESLVGSGWSECLFEADLAGFDRVLAVRK